MIAVMPSRSSVPWLTTVIERSWTVLSICCHLPTRDYNMVHVIQQVLFQIVMSSSSSRNPKRVHCPHCDEFLSRSSYYQHKQLYFDETLQKWNKDDHNHAACESNPPLSSWVSFEFSPSCCPAGSIYASCGCLYYLVIYLA